MNMSLKLVLLSINTIESGISERVIKYNIMLCNELHNIIQKALPTDSI